MLVVPSRGLDPRALGVPVHAHLSPDGRKVSCSHRREKMAPSVVL
jgi:hypothetical protein